MLQMNEARKQLSSALLMSKASVLSWWVKQTTISTRLPIPPASPPPRSPSGQMDGAAAPSPKPTSFSSNDLTPREHDEHDLIEVRIFYLIISVTSQLASQNKKQN